MCRVLAGMVFMPANAVTWAVRFKIGLGLQFDAFWQFGIVTVLARLSDGAAAVLA